jgi:mono/diheme cytochrome c family protein
MRALWLSLLLVVGCASARRGETVVGPVQLNANQREGQVLFMHNCNQCHPGGQAGVGTSINNKPVPRVAEKLQIRQGVLGIMPKFSDEDLSDREVDRILDYLDELQRHHPS